jgi:uncharacterized protein (TIGR03435 family)
MRGGSIVANGESTLKRQLESAVDLFRGLLQEVRSRLRLRAKPSQFALIAVSLVTAGVVVARYPAVEAQQSASKPVIVGTWQGTVQTPDGTALRVVLKITQSPSGTLGAALYNVDQGGGRSIAISSISFNGSTLKYAIQFIDMTGEGRISADGNSIAGTVTENGSSLQLVLQRATPETEWTIPTAPLQGVPMATDAQPGIEVATIKPTNPDEGRTFITFRGHEIIVVRYALTDLIESAWNLNEKQIVNWPAWAATYKCDIDIQADQPGNPDREQLRTLLKKLLADRFTLRFHNEQREMSAYVLAVSKNGPKLARSHESDDQPRTSVGPLGLIRAGNATMADFASTLQRLVLDRPVVDRTGLEGRWQFVLKWMPDETQFGGQLNIPAQTDAADALPSLFSAMEEQLGLKLEPQKTTVDVMVIDRAEHPSPN